MYDISIFVLSDSIGETGGKIARATVAQYPHANYEIKRYPYILDKGRISAILDEAKQLRSVIIFSTVVEEHAKFIEEEGEKFGIPTVNIMREPLAAFSKVMGEKPVRESGIVRKMDETYFQKVDAIEFAVKYDDGKDPRGIRKADICLVGISRTSKTPLSMYLANKNYLVANVPLVPEVPVSDELFAKDKMRIFGLTTNAKVMMHIREERLRALGLPTAAAYSELGRIEQEIEYAETIMKKLGCTTIDVSNKAIEETAELIMEIMRERFPYDS
ncbi:MAG: pyruvate, water dikinase regulatory protein [Tissierellia bacterium]|nr:pyruvate, water dikinase regulatory protein [Tissierellia bacterium]